MFGVIFWDKKEYIYRDESNKVKFGKFEAISDLNSKTIWFTNLTKQEVWRLGHFDIVNLKHAHYLNTPFQKILKVLVGNDELNDAKEIKSALTKMLFIFEKIMLLALANQSNFDLTAEEFYLGASKALNQGDSNNIELPNLLQDALFQSYQDTIDCLTESEFIDLINNGYTVKNVKKNGLLYANEMLDSIVVPSHEYTLYNQKDIQQQIDKIKEINKNSGYIDSNTFFKNYVNNPFLIQINKKTVKPEYEAQKDILEKNNITYLKAKRVERKWINSVEFSYLSEFFHFEIINAILFKKPLLKDDLINLYGLNNLLIKTNDLSYFSIAITLIMENYMLAFQEKQYETHNVSLMNSFLAAQDKKELLVIALMFKKKGIHVKSYGRNNIQIMVKDDISHNSLSTLNHLISDFGYMVF